MRHCLEIPIAGEVGDPRSLAELARMAEDAGWDGFFLEDYIVHWSAPDAATFDPWVCLAAVAMATERIRIGLTVTPLARRRPWKVAREAATLDHLSNGRMILGVGLGTRTDLDLTKFGELLDDRARAAALDEALAVVVGLWSGQPFAFEGQHYRVEEVTFLPRSVQQPRIPVWVGGGWPRPGPTRRAARWDGSLLFKAPPSGTNWVDQTPDDVRAMRADLARLRGGPLDGYDVVVGGHTPGDDPERARARTRELADAGATWWAEFGPFRRDKLVERIRQGPARFE